MNKQRVTILCASLQGHYPSLGKKYDLDIYSESRSAYMCDLAAPVIAHPPCAQWSRLHKFAHKDEYIKGLGVWCFDKVKEFGGILEHPSGSHLFRFCGIPKNELISVDLHWWDFPARKRTYLWFNKCQPLSYPLNFNAYKGKVSHNLTGESRSITPYAFNEWLIQSIIQTYNK